MPSMWLRSSTGGASGGRTLGLLDGYLAERDAFQTAHSGTLLPAVLRYSIEAGTGGVAVAEEEIAELEAMLAEQRARLAVHEPVEVFAIYAFSFVDQDGSERLCRRNEVHRLLPPAAALAIDASVAERVAWRGFAPVTPRRLAEMEGPETEPVRLGDPIGFGTLSVG
ncbi:MAG: hypothetical protein E5X33_29730 [Mesorhizobium sp.]|uniref:hypothetical protein n=1 Tax=Mesorhizobium sp. TaxID=1871066 RepID=UPI001229B378|nr:hypothetical protein [Mesorhizobium sp.]TIR16169.1 MAG: hypothetical protein E5X33_29730 [Mesorhizobium sp.]